MRRIGKWVLVPTIALSLLLVLSWLSTYIAPPAFWPAAFLGIAYPVLVILNLIFAMIWITRLRWQFLISIVPIILSFGLLGAYFQLGSSSPAPDSGAKELRVISYNVHGFDKTNYYNTADFGNGNLMFNWIYAENSDIACIQEFYSNSARNFNMLDTFKVADQFNYFSSALYRDDWKTFSLMIMSKHPVADQGKLVDSRSRTYAQWADIEADGTVLRVVNVHLRSLHLNTELSIIDNMDADFYSDEDFKKGTRSIFFKMKAAFIQRAEQSQALDKFIKGSPYPVILCGDLNDTPASYTYRVLNRALNDAFRTAGYGAGRTYNGKLPSYRIDYMFHSKDVKVKKFRIGNLKASDHFPLSATIELP